MKVFHYSHIENWQDIQRGSWRNQNKPGLRASRRVGQEDREASNTMVIFALLEPLPDNWVRNQHFKGIWNYLRHNIGTLLLELDVDPEKDQVFLVDRGHVEGALYEDKEGLPQKYLHTSKRAGERAYMESKVPLKDYLERANELDYTLPEVIITGNLPLEKIRISEQQPLIEGDLRRYSGEIRQMLIRDIQRIPELSRWYQQREHGRELREWSSGSLGEKLK